MAAIGQNEVSSAINPVITFVNQTNGFLAVLDSLSFSVFLVTPEKKTLKVGPTVVDVVANLLVDGRWWIALDPASESMSPGSYEILWSYVLESGGPTKTAVTSLEILDENAFYAGNLYVGYLPTYRLDAQFKAPTAELQLAVDQASRFVEEITQRYFEPRYNTFYYNVRRAGPSIFLDDPVIGISTIEVDSGGVIPGQTLRTEISLDSLRVFNRHLNGLMSPDDRENPKLEFAKIGIPSIYSEGRPTFPEGVKNMIVTGVFGYTDNNGTPVGMTPRPLANVVMTLAMRALQDPTGTDIATQLPGRISEAKTRDQRIKFATSGSTSFDILTGDPKVDSVLLKYRRPPHIGAAG